MCNSISNCTQQSPFGWALGRKDRSPDGTDAAGTRVSQRLTAVTRTRTTDIDLQIQTDEGDTVTLTLHREVDLASINYRYRAQGPDGRQSGALRGFSLTTDQSLQIQVEGSLSDRELADIQSLVDRLAQSGALSGRASSATPDGARPGEFDSLTGYALDVTRTDTLDVTVARLREYRPASGPALPPAPSVVPAPIEAQPVDSALPVGDESAGSLLAGKQPVPSPVAPTAGRTPAGTLAAWMLDLLRQASGPAVPPGTSIAGAPVETQPVDFAPEPNFA